MTLAKHHPHMPMTDTNQPLSKQCAYCHKLKPLAEFRRRTGKRSRARPAAGPAGNAARPAKRDPLLHCSAEWELCLCPLFQLRLPNPDLYLRPAGHRPHRPRLLQLPNRLYPKPICTPCRSAPKRVRPQPLPLQSRERRVRAEPSSGGNRRSRSDLSPIRRTPPP